MTLPRCAPCALVLVVMGCGSREAPPVMAAPEVASVAPAPSPVPPASAVRAPSSVTTGAPIVAPPPAASCDDALPPEDLLRGNVVETSMTGLGEIVASSKLGPDGKSPAPSRGYVLFRYEVRVLEWFSGSGPETMVLEQRAEADFDPRAPGHLLFFSACRGDAEGIAYEPDVGYFFPVAPECREHADRRARAAAKRAGPKRKTLAACKR